MFELVDDLPVALQRRGDLVLILGPPPALPGLAHGRDVPGLRRDLEALGIELDGTALWRNEHLDGHRSTWRSTEVGDLRPERNRVPVEAGEVLRASLVEERALEHPPGESDHGFPDTVLGSVVIVARGDRQDCRPAVRGLHMEGERRECAGDLLVLAAHLHEGNPAPPAALLKAGALRARMAGEEGIGHGELALA